MPEQDGKSGAARDASPRLPGGVRVVSVEGDLPPVAMAAGVSTRHLVGARVMVRLIEIEQGGAVQLNGRQAAEHAVLVLHGAVELVVGN